MYDTVNLRLNSEEAGAVSIMEETPAYLCPDSLALHDYNGYPVATGRVGNLSVSVTPHRVKVGGGSLARWFSGSNLHTLTRGEVRQAVEALSDTLHLPLDRATVVRFDIGTNLQMDQPAPAYFSHLGPMKGATRLEQPNALYYKTRGGSVVVYDKGQEARARGEPLPEQYQGGHLLRCERRYLGRLKPLFGTVTGATLYQPEFFNQAIAQWLNSYKSITKTNDITANFTMITSKRQFYKLAVLELIKDQGGETRFLHQIDQARRRGTLTPKQAYTLRQAVKEVCKAGGGLTSPSQAITELDSKMEEAAKYYTSE